MAKGFDTTENCTPHIAAIKRAGYGFVCRYYSHSAWKDIARPEAVALSEAGIYIVAVWESAGDHAGYFSHVQGVLDGQAAYSFGRAIGQPNGGDIYFAVDYDAVCHPGSPVWKYFEGVNEKLKAQVPEHQYEPGVYGSGLVCETLFKAGLVKKTWLAQSMGWGGSRTYKDWNIKQGPQTTFAGMDIDTDTSAAKGGGGFLVK